MPVSEDEFERPIPIVGNQSFLSKAEQRKSNKPIMEKRRRARINHCLNELKTLILDAMKKDPARHSKLEKADILEMTVKHLQQIQRQQLATTAASDPAVIVRFKNGFDECAAEVSRYIGHLEGVDSGVKQRLAAHLHRCMSSIQQMSTFPQQQMLSALTQNCDKNTLLLPNMPSIPGDVNNNSNQNTERIHIPSGLHLIPSRLPTGEFALLVPNSNHISTFLNAPPGATFQFPHNTSITMSSVLSPTFGGNLNPNTNRTSAFTAVCKNQDYPSPTSTVDMVKKESNSPGANDCGTSSHSNTMNFSNLSYLQNYNTKNYEVTEIKKEGNKINEEQPFKKLNLLQTNHDTNKISPKIEKCKTFEFKSDSMEYDQKIIQRPCSSSFQQTLADSTTSFVQLKEPEMPESGFKPFHVEIPNSHLKAHISISNPDDVKNSLQIHQKPNPNLTLNPNKFHQKSPYKFARNQPNPDNNFSDIGYEKFLNIEPLSIVTNSERIQEKNDLCNLSNTEYSIPLLRPTSCDTFRNAEGIVKIPEESFSRGIKRTLYNGSPNIFSLNSNESPKKTSRISLNVTVTDDKSQDDTNLGNHCKRISVIVEDASTSSERENKNEVTVNVSSQKDMWRPW